MKDSYYFSHDYNPTNDPKIICLLSNHGGLGYGVFWRITEMLHEEESHKLAIKGYIIEAIAKQMKAELKQIQSIIDDCVKYELLKKDSQFFWSDRVLKNINDRDEKRELKVKAGRIGGINSGKQRKKDFSNPSSAEAVLKQNEPNEAKERKGKERKVNIILESSNSPKQEAILFFNNESEQGRVIKEISVRFSSDEQPVKNEILKFVSYWTELNKSGTKQRWEMERTFEVSRRLATWFSRVRQFQQVANKSTFSSI